MDACRSSGEYLLRFPPSANEPLIATMKRNLSGTTRPSMPLGTSVTQAIMMPGVYAWVKPSCSVSRSNASVLSEGHTSSVRFRMPRSTRPPPPEQDSISSLGCLARSRSRMS